MAWRDSFVVKPSLRVNRETSSRRDSDLPEDPSSIATNSSEDDNNSLLELERKTHHTRRNEDSTIFSGTSFAVNDRTTSSQGFLKNVTFGSTFITREGGSTEPQPGLTLEEFFPEKEERTNSKSFYSRAPASTDNTTTTEKRRPLSLRARKSQSATSMNGATGRVSFGADVLAKTLSAKHLMQKTVDNEDKPASLTTRLRNLSVNMRPKSMHASASTSTGLKIEDLNVA